MFWVREDSNQTRFYDSPKVAIENSPGMSVLTIMSVNQRFTGAYSCHAKNKVGEQQMMTMLNVDVPPTILSAQKGSFQNNFKDITAIFKIFSRSISSMTNTRVILY